MDYRKAAAYWDEQDASAKKADRETLLAEAEKFIRSHNTCALAAGGGSLIRCTPIEYTYYEGCFWMLSEGGRKFAGLEINPNVCLAIYDPYEGFGKLGGMQVSGKAGIVEPWTEPYLSLLRFKKIPEDALRKLSHPMYLIRVAPEKIDFLNSEFKKMGFDSRQQIVF